MEKVSDKDLISRVEEIFDSDGSFPLCYRAYVRSMKEYHEGGRELSEGQRGYLEELIPFYGQVVEANKRIIKEGKVVELDEKAIKERREKIKSALEELLRLAEKRKSFEMESYKKSVELAVKQIEDGYHIWRCHLEKAIKAIDVLLTYNKGKKDPEGKKALDRLRGELVVFHKETLYMPKRNYNLRDFFRWYYKNKHVVAIKVD